MFDDVVPVLTLQKQARASALKFAVTSRPTEPEPLSKRQRDSAATTAEIQHGNAADDEDDQGNNTDKGYEEDSEDGFSSEDEEPSFMLQAHKTALARAREAQLANARPTSTSPPPRVPPPPRRGRGHVRVDPAVGDSQSRCTRHYSPPPDTRAPRSAPPGPRDGRAGSPLPERIDVDDEDDDDDDDDNNEDDSNAMTNAGSEAYEGPVPASSTPVSDIAVAPAASIGTGVRNILRRASEHLPSFRRPSFTAPVSDDSAVALDDDNASTDNGRVLLSRARSLGSRTKPVSILSTQDNSIPSRPIACPTSRTAM